MTKINVKDVKMAQHDDAMSKRKKNGNIRK